MKHIVHESVVPGWLAEWLKGHLPEHVNAYVNTLRSHETGPFGETNTRPTKITVTLTEEPAQ